MNKDITKLNTEEQVEAILGNPELADRLSSADLKRVNKWLVRLVMNVGARGGNAEARLRDMELHNELLHARIRELTGAKPPAWSYLHKEEALRLHAFDDFAVVADTHGSVVCGEENGVLHPIYEYDFAELGTTQAVEAAQSMLVHLRQTFIPRNKEIIA